MTGSLGGNIPRVDMEELKSGMNRLERRLRTPDAVVIGLGAMMGAGVFAALGPAAQAVGNSLPLSLSIAAIIAYMNAHSVSRLAALYPESGGVYVYGNKRLGSYWGFLAGWAFVIGKLASCSAMAMTFASYAAPEYMRPLGVMGVLTLTAVNYRGIQKTVFATRIILGVVLLSLALVIFSGLFGGAVNSARLWPWEEADLMSIFQASGLLFFAFAGYARIATLGEEVIAPEKTIPHAIIIALGITFGVYVLIVGTALLTVDSDVLAAAPAPLATVVESGRWNEFSPVVRVGATVASLGVLLSLLAGIGRTSFAMSAKGDLPKYFAAIHPRYKVPHRAELAAGIVIATLVSLTDLRGAIGFSSFAILTYYAIANASALTLKSGSQLIAKSFSLGGLVGCIIVAVSLPAESVTGGFFVLGVGSLVFILKRK